MDNFDLKKYLAEGKLLKENESSWVSNFEKLLADELDIEIRDLRMKVIDPHLIKIGAGFSQQGLDVFPEIVNSILQTPEFKGKMVFVGDEDVAEEISKKHPELEDDVLNDEFFWIYVKSPLSEGKLREGNDGRSYGYVKVRLIDYTDGKNQEKRYSQDFDVIEEFDNIKEFEAWLNNNYPDAVKHKGKNTAEIFGKDWVTKNKHIDIRVRDPHSNGWGYTYVIPNK